MKLDDFESVFRSAVKQKFHLGECPLSSVMLVTDLPASDTEALERKVKKFLSSSVDAQALGWRNVVQGEYSRVSELLELIRAFSPDLVVSYRHLRGREKHLEHSLGSYIDSLTQILDCPVLLLPPIDRSDFDQRLSGLERVLVVTDHIIGDDRLVSWAVHLSHAKQGTVVLAHVEDATTWEQYKTLISMIPDANTETTLERLHAKLLGRPMDYMKSIIDSLKHAGIEDTVVPIVTMGHAVTDYKRIIDEHDINLVVMNTKDDHQLAMHGMAYAIAIEMFERPLLML